MNMRTVLEYPDPRLRMPAAQVETFDADLDRLIADLCACLSETGALAVCAPQFGDLRAVLAIRDAATDAPPEIYVNPVVRGRGAWGIIEESCLSLPGITGHVIRATEAIVEAQDARGTTFERELTGMPAVCLLHEMDHLVGKLFIDRMNPIRKLRFHTGPGLRARRMAKTRAA